MTTDLGEALTAANVPQLVQTVIDPLLLEYQRRYSPLVRTIPTKQWSSTVYNFNRRTTRAPGGFVRDGGARPLGSSTYEQFAFTMRNLQSVGAVTGYAQEVTRDLIGDLRQQEIASCVQGLLWDIETAMLWGHSTATASGPWPQFDGLDALVNQFTSTSTNPQNSIDGAGAALSFSQMDRLIDCVETNAAMPIFTSTWMFLMSPTSASKIAQLETPLQRFLTTTEVAAGLNVTAYRDIPMIKTSFLSNRGSTMGVVTATPSTTGGTLGAGTYYYVIEPVVARYGSLTPSAEVSQATTGATSTVSLNFAVPTGPDGAAPLSYRVYRGTSTGNATLLGVVDAVATLQGDGVTPNYATTIVDTGTNLVPQVGAQVGTPAATYVGGSSQKPRVAGGEDIYLVPRDPDLLLRPYVRDVRPVDVYPTTSSPDSLPFALVSDCTLALRAPKLAGRLRNTLATL
jgi:hypothetical protein